MKSHPEFLNLLRGLSLLRSFSLGKQFEISYRLFKFLLFLYGQQRCVGPGLEFFLGFFIERYDFITVFVIVLDNNFQTVFDYSVTLFRTQDFFVSELIRELLLDVNDERTDPVLQIELLQNLHRQIPVVSNDPGKVVEGQEKFLQRVVINLFAVILQVRNHMRQLKRTDQRMERLPNRHKPLDFGCD